MFRQVKQRNNCLESKEETDDQWQNLKKKWKT